MVRNTMNRSKRVNRIMREDEGPPYSQEAVKELLTQMYNEAFEDGYAEGVEQTTSGTCCYGMIREGNQHDLDCPNHR